MNSIVNKKGSALLMTILILTSVLTVALGVSTLVQQGLKIGRIQLNSTKSYFAAEAGIEKVLWEIRKNNMIISSCNNDECVDFSSSPAVCGTCGSTSEVLDNGASYVVKYTNGSSHVFTSIGAYDNNRRTVEVSFTE